MNQEAGDHQESQSESKKSANLADSLGRISNEVESLSSNFDIEGVKEWTSATVVQYLKSELGP